MQRIGLLIGLSVLATLVALVAFVLVGSLRAPPPGASPSAVQRPGASQPEEPRSETREPAGPTSSEELSVEAPAEAGEPGPQAALAAAGRVLDEGGSPVAGATVRGDVRLDLGEGRGAHAPDPKLVARSDAGGHFELRGEVGGASLRLSAWTERAFAGPVDCLPGASGVVLRLRPTGRLEGRVLVDEGVPVAALACRLTAQGGGVGVWNASATVGPDGTFTFEGVPSGSYDLLLLALAGRHELGSLEALRVPAGGSCEDRRLVAIDLRGRLRSLTLELVPPQAGTPIAGLAALRPSSGEDEGDGESWIEVSGPRLAILTRAQALDVDLRLRGFRTERLRLLREDARVTLRPGLVVRLRLAPGVRLPEPPLLLRAVVQEPGPAWVSSRLQEGVFGEDGQALLEVGEPGALEVRWWVQQDGESRLLPTLPEEAPPPLVVREVPGEQVFVVAPPARAYAVLLTPQARR